MPKISFRIVAASRESISHVQTGAARKPDRRSEPGTRGRRLARMRIGELSKRTGVSARSLRYYEEQGLLTSSRSDAGQRHYSDAEVQRVSLIRQLFDAGMSSREIATVLPCVDTPAAPDVVELAFATMTRERDRIDAGNIGWWHPGLLPL